MFPVKAVFFLVLGKCFLLIFKNDYRTKTLRIAWNDQKIPASMSEVVEKSIPMGVSLVACARVTAHSGRAIRYKSGHTQSLALRAFHFYRSRRSAVVRRITLHKVNITDESATESLRPAEIANPI